MSVPQPAGLTIYDRLQAIDRRILWLILLAVVAIPVKWPVTIPNAPLPMSQSLWDTINATPPNKIVLISSDWSRGTRGENQGQMAALLNHLMARRIHFAISSFDTAQKRVAIDLITQIARKYGYRYGIDWISFGFIPSSSATNYIKGINVDITSAVPRDSEQKQPLGKWPVMQGIQNVDNIHIVVEISASAWHSAWIQLLKPGTKIGFCPTSVMAPESIPYYTAGQLAGVLWGAKGAYDYEQINVRNGIGQYSFGRRYMGPLSAAFALVILSIVVGNTAMFLGRRHRARQGA